jgi:hypothetical protein
MRMLAAVVVVSFTLVNILAAEPATPASLADIMANVAKATTPDKEYQVEVAQTVTKAAAEGEAPSKSAFTQTWAPSRGFAMSKPVDLSPKSADNAPAKPSIQVQIDLQRSLKDLQKWTDIVIAPDQLDGRASFKISAKSPGADASSSVWVDAERWCVLKIYVESQGKPLVEGTFEHRRVNDACWLLSKATMKQGGGTVISQEFGTYSIEK